MAPVQFAIVPINLKHNEYCKSLEKSFKQRFLRVKANYEDMHMREKIKRFELDKIPFILVVGDKDIIAGGFSVRSRKLGNLGVMDFQQLNSLIEPDIQQGKPQYIGED